MSTQNNKRKLDDAYGPTFDPGLDIATVVFSHVQCVKTRDNLARVSDSWEEASMTAAAYPLRFDCGAFPDMRLDKRGVLVIIRRLDNDEALSLPYERVVGLLGEAAEYVCDFAARRGSVRLLKWTRENNLWARENKPSRSADTCYCAAMLWAPARSQVLARERVPLGLPHVLVRSLTRAPAHSPVLARERVPLGLEHGLLRRLSQTMGLPAVRGGQQVPRGGSITPRTTRSTSDEMSPLDRRLACITNTTSNQPVSFPWSRPAEASSSPPSPPRYRTASSSAPSPYSRPWRQPPARTTASPHSRWTPRHHP